eukprot:gene18398-biopygen14481
MRAALWCARRRCVQLSNASNAAVRYATLAPRPRQCPVTPAVDREQFGRRFTAKLPAIHSRGGPQGWPATTTPTTATVAPSTPGAGGTTAGAHLQAARGGGGSLARPSWGKSARGVPSQKRWARACINSLCAFRTLGRCSLLHRMSQLFCTSRPGPPACPGRVNAASQQNITSFHE